MNVLAAALVPETALPDPFPKELANMKLMLLLALIVVLVQIHALQVQYQLNKFIHRGCLRFYGFVYITD
jgi:hypothetical protein